MKYIVYWIWIWITISSPAPPVDEFGRTPLHYSTPAIAYITKYRMKMSREFDDKDSARSFFNKAKLQQDIDSVKIDSIFYIGDSKTK